MSAVYVAERRKLLEERLAACDTRLQEIVGAQNQVLTERALIQGALLELVTLEEHLKTAPTPD